MFGELALSGLMAFSPISNTAVQINIDDFKHMALYASSFLNEQFLNNYVYPLINGNNYKLMDNSESYSKKEENPINRMLTVFKSILVNEVIEFEEEHNYFSFLSELKCSDKDYDTFLVLAYLDNNIKVCNAISLFLSQRDYRFISAEEERFVLAVLENGNLSMQTFALEAILNWDNISDLEALKRVKIPNRYLQEDLEEFIQQRS